MFKFKKVQLSHLLLEFEGALRMHEELIVSIHLVFHTLVSLNLASLLMCMSILMVPQIDPILLINKNDINNKA